MSTLVNFISKIGNKWKIAIKEEERREGREKKEDKKEIMRNPSLDQCIMEHKDSKVT